MSVQKFGTAIVAGPESAMARQFEATLEAGEALARFAAAMGRAKALSGERYRFRSSHPLIAQKRKEFAK